MVSLQHLCTHKRFVNNNNNTLSLRLSCEGTTPTKWFHKWLSIAIRSSGLTACVWRHEMGQQQKTLKLRLFTDK